MPSTRQQLDIWKMRLLDLSRRNRLLHARSSLAGTIALTHPSAEQLFDALARRRRKLTFAAALTLEQRLAALSWDTPAIGVTMRLDRIPTPPPKSGQVATDLDPVDQERALYNLRLRARSALVEQGVNVLFLALGFLEWYAPEAPEEIWRSPLLLLPVEILRAPLGAEYALRLLDDEVVLNPTLAHKLRQQFGIELPELPDDVDELQIDQLFAAIGALVAGRDGWRVAPDATLGLFSFLKLLMYHDLDRAAAAETHPILALLAGEPGAEIASLRDHGGESNARFWLDRRPPEDCFQVLDADSSQAEAIEAARAGASFVLQGPPGTGKSQTIANIIAECLAAGQRVLFVSEKMAALQVVYDRLRQCGLDEFCLELHSHKSSKRIVLDALGAALAAGPAPADPAFPYAELAAARAQLNAYAAALHAPHGPLRWTPYAVHARLAALAGAPECDAPLGDLDAYTPERMGAVDALLARLDARRDLLQSIPGNAWRDCAVTASSFEQRGRIRARLRALVAVLGELRPIASGLAARLGLPAPEDLGGARALATLVCLLREAQTAPPTWIDDFAAAEDRRALIAEVRARYTALAEAEARLAPRYRDTVLDLDLDGMADRFANQYAGWTRVLRPQYHRDMAALRGALQPGATLDAAGAPDDLRLAAEVRAARRWAAEHDEQLAGQLAPLFDGRATAWDSLADAADWTARLLALELPHPLPGQICSAASGAPAARAALLAAAGPLDAALSKLDEELAFFSTLFPTDGDRQTTVPLETGDWRLETRTGSPASSPQPPAPGSVVGGRWSTVDGRDPAVLLERMGDLDIWWEFCELRRAAEPLGVAAFVDALGADRAAAGQPRAAFHRRFCALWLDAAYERASALRQFRRAPHEALVARFRELDAAQLGAAQIRLRRLLAARRPSPTATAAPGSELGILRRELQKQRRHKPIRQLFREIPDLLGKLKPCLLMSPLSVSQFLDPDAARFDLVIFDEASQIRVEDAAGAVLRGRALVVVGDNKQLPPTSFFMAGGEEDFDEDDPQAPASFESILDAAAAAGLPARLLRWHYRSRDESLIAFSNAHFYDGRLATFPGVAAGEQRGVCCEHVAGGVYDRQASRTNLAEARRVAELVWEHLKSSPGRSLGVVAFSQPQQLAILHELERRRAADSSLDALLDEGRAEPLFVKNLENVQGDERDVMIVSVGYGRDAAGRLLMNFGPLNQQGGERRLNVAITRAREQVVLVSSLLPEEIDLKRTQHPGPRLLRAYLEYARRGGMDQALGDRQAAIGEQATPIAHRPSPIASVRFEDELAIALEQRGLSLARQIGRSDFRIDIAIRDPRDPDRFLLGVECDGDDYRDAPTARDRERLREQVLGALGWRIHRAWSAAWAQDPAAEVERIMQAMEVREE